MNWATRSCSESEPAGPSPGRFAAEPGFVFVGAAACVTRTVNRPAARDLRYAISLYYTICPAQRPSEQRREADGAEHRMERSDARLRLTLARSRNPLSRRGFLRRRQQTPDSAHEMIHFIHTLLDDQRGPGRGFIET